MSKLIASAIILYSPSFNALTSCGTVAGSSVLGIAVAGIAAVGVAVVVGVVGVTAVGVVAVAELLATTGVSAAKAKLS